MKNYKFWTRTDAEGITEHEVIADSCKEAYEQLKRTGYKSNEITMTSYKK